MSRATLETPSLHADADHGHDPHLAHHFDTPAQQVEAATLGMWLFLATEILLFGGLFCAYAVYRANHPEIFEYAHVFLNKTLGATNTVILLTSSFTMAAGVWAAERGRRRMLQVMLLLTIACAFGFLGIKYVEYKNKWEEGLLWGAKYHPQLEERELAEAHRRAGDHPARAPSAEMLARAETAARAGEVQPHHSEPAATSSAAGARTTQATTSGSAAATESETRWTGQGAQAGPGGLASRGPRLEVLAPEQQVRNVHLFFSIYFGMTGLHGLHVVAGICAISWLLFRATRGDFSAQYCTPVPMVGLYWHVVDLVWIYLFPLLYLIH